MIKVIKNIVNVVKSFINDNLDGDYLPHESSKKDIYDPNWLNKEVSVSELKLPHEPTEKDLYNEAYVRQYHTHAEPIEMTEKDLEPLESTFKNYTNDSIDLKAFSKDARVNTIIDKMINANLLLVDARKAQYDEMIKFDDIMLDSMENVIDQNIKTKIPNKSIIDPVLEAVNEFSKPDPIIQQMNDLGYVNPMFSDIKKEIKAGRIDYNKLNYDPNETAYSMNNLINTAKSLESNDFTEIKSIVSDLSEKLTQYNKWLLELNWKISNYENKDILQAVSERHDNGGYGIDLPLEKLENVDDAEFFKNKDIPEVLLANAKEDDDLITEKDFKKVFDILVENFRDEAGSPLMSELESEVYSVNLKQKQQDALNKFKEMHQQAVLSSNVGKFKNRPSRNVVDELEATLGDKKIKQLSKSYKEKTKTTKPKSSTKKTKKVSKSKSKKV